MLAVKARNRRLLRIPEQRQLLDTFAALIAIALERVHYVGVAQDAVVRMESERLRNSLLAALSHDLRTPLTVLVGLAESLALTKPPLSPEQFETAEAIQDEARRMSTLVEQSARHGAHRKRRGEAQSAMAAAGRGGGRGAGRGARHAEAAPWSKCACRAICRWCASMRC